MLDKHGGWIGPDEWYGEDGELLPNAGDIPFHPGPCTDCEERKALEASARQEPEPDPEVEPEPEGDPAGTPDAEPEPEPEPETLLGVGYPPAEDEFEDTLGEDEDPTFEEEEAARAAAEILARSEAPLGVPAAG